MKPTLILHIGAHRTATSALQDYLFENFDNLLTKKFFYAFKTRRHLKLMNDLFGGERSVAEISQILVERMERRGGATTAILSDEDICTRRNLETLAAFRDTFDVKIAFTVRRQDTWLESWFFQNIKWQWNKKLSHCSFDDFMALREDFHWIHYDTYLQHIESLFGQENILLNVLEASQMPEGPITAFCNSIGLTDRDGFVPASHTNESFSPQISEFMRCLPLDKAPPPYRGVLTQACAQIDRAIQGGERKQSERLLPHDRRVAVMAEYEAGNQAVAQRYFDRDRLFFDPLPGPETPLATMTLPSDPYALMQDYVAPLLEDIIAHHQAVLNAAAKD